MIGMNEIVNLIELIVCENILQNRSILALYV